MAALPRGNGEGLPASDPGLPSRGRWLKFFTDGERLDAAALPPAQSGDAVEIRNDGRFAAREW